YELERLGEVHDAHLPSARVRTQQVLPLDRPPESRAGLALGRHALRSGAGLGGPVSLSRVLRPPPRLLFADDCADGELRRCAHTNRPSDWRGPAGVRL